MTALSTSPAYVRPPIGHVPARPVWQCRRGCGPWPCAPARLTLRAVFADDPVGLAIEMATYLFEAAGDLLRLHPDTPPEPQELYARFIGFTRRRGVP